MTSLDQGSEPRAKVRTARLEGGRIVAPRTFFALIADEVARAWRYDRRLSVALARIDPMNRPGHPGAVLSASEIEITLLDHLATDLRAPDKIALIGSGELGLLFPEATERHVRNAAQRLCSRVAETLFRVRDLTFQVTLSIGTASLNHRVRSAEQLMMAARQERRRAYSQGGNGVSSAVPIRAQSGHVRSAEMH